jgi:hypothetical protein
MGQSLFSQHCAHRTFKRPGAISPEFFIECLKALNQISHVFAWIHATSGFTEMGAAAKGSVSIDRTFAITSE